MPKLETIDKKQTNWEGLWWHREYNGFSSAVISLAELRKFKGNVRLYVRKNKYFNGGENGRPNYHFCLKDADSDTFSTLDVERDERYAKWDYFEELMGMTVVEGQQCSNCGHRTGYKAFTRYCPDCGKRMLDETGEEVE